MKTQEQIVKRIDVLTSMIGSYQDEIYDIALRDKRRKCIWKIHDIDKKAVKLYSELLVLQWVLDDKSQ